MTINSRQKGARGEREFAHFLLERGIEARRGQQFSGGSESPDVISKGSTEHIHWEVKRVEAGNPYKWMEQALRDAGVAKLPVVAHKRNNKDWIAILPMTSFVQMLEQLYAQRS